MVTKDTEETVRVKKSTILFIFIFCRLRIFLCTGPLREHVIGVEYLSMVALPKLGLPERNNYMFFSKIQGMLRPTLLTSKAGYRNYLGKG